MVGVKLRFHVDDAVVQRHMSMEQMLRGNLRRYKEGVPRIVYGDWMDERCVRVPLPVEGDDEALFHLVLYAQQEALSFRGCQVIGVG